MDAPTVECLYTDALTLSDARDLVGLSWSVWPPKRAADLDETAHQMVHCEPYDGPPDRRPRVFCVRGEGRIVAKANAFPRVITTAQGRLTVLALAGVCTDPAQRGRGLGRLVVRAALGMVDGGAYGHSLFQTSLQVQPFYEKLGACRVGNPCVDSLADDPTASPWWDPVVMRYPASAAWPEGPIDLLGRAW